MAERSSCRITLFPHKGQTKISAHLYGHFAEHLGRCIYDGFWPDENSTVARKNGIRQDVVAALREIGIPNLRWPGGCFADSYHWRDGIGDPAKRATTINAHWGRVPETNRFGTHEFMDLCTQLSCEPYFAGNVGSGSVREMHDWLEYLTAPAGSRLADLRAQNGHSAPWDVQFWGVGNENWACGGNMRPEYYADLFNRYAAYCRHYGGKQLVKIACGPGDIFPDRKDSNHWTDTLMRISGKHMDALSLHYYTVTHDWQNKGSATVFDESEWIKCLSKALGIETRIKDTLDVMQQHDPDGRVKLVVDEWGTWHEVEPGTERAFLHQQNTLRDAMAAALTLNIFNLHADRIMMANLAQTVNVLQAVVLTEGDTMIKTPTWHVFRMFRPHMDATLIPATAEISPQQDVDALPPVQFSASANSGEGIFITLCNPQPDRETETEISSEHNNLWFDDAELLTAESLSEHNTVSSPSRVQAKPFTAVRNTAPGISLTLPPASILALRCKQA